MLRKPSSSWIKVAGDAALDRFARMFGDVHDLSDPYYARALALQLSARLPGLYAVIITTTMVTAFVYRNSGQIFFGIVLPSIVALQCLVRARYWSGHNTMRRSDERIVSDLENMPKLGFLVGILTATWTLVLYSNGSETQQAFTHFAVIITGFVSIMSLGLIPRAAVLAAVSSVLPPAAIFLIHDHPSRVEIVATLLVLTVFVIRLALKQRTDFETLVKSRLEVEERARVAQKLTEELQEQAFVDLLTGMANRRAILGQLSNMLVDTQRPSPWLAILDLDRFKQINDFYGHSEGDLVLIEVARRLSRFHDRADLGRLGGDEFILLLDGSRSYGEVQQTLDAVLKSIARPIETDFRSYKVSASIGLRKTARMKMNACLERADAALYKAKEKPGRFVLFSPEDEVEFQQGRRIAEAIRTSDFNESLDIVFQPIVDFDLQETVSLEALVRWRQADSFDIDSARFIEMAEASGRVFEVTTFVIEQSIRMFAQMRAGIGLQINLSARDLSHPEIAPLVARTLSRYGVKPADITFEVTETALISDFNRAVRVIGKLRKMGVRIALDDFGTGYSSLVYINRLPIDQIKIDREFARSLGEGDKSAALVTTIWGLSHQLGIQCTIEGIETFDQAVRARAIGLRRMQGFYFAKPLPFERLRETGLVELRATDVA